MRARIIRPPYYYYRYRPVLYPLRVARSGGLTCPGLLSSSGTVAYKNVGEPDLVIDVVEDKSGKLVPLKPSQASFTPKLKKGEDGSARFCRGSSDMYLVWWNQNIEKEPATKQIAESRGNIASLSRWARWAPWASSTLPLSRPVKSIL
jgi:hypothetical protein